MERPIRHLGPARRLVSSNRSAVIVGAVAVALVALGGAILGLAPPLIAALAVLVLAAAFGLLAWRHRRGLPGDRTHLSAVVAHFSLAAVAVFGVIQLVPYGRDHTNPAVTGEPAWSSPRTRELMVNACFDCHSNEVDWPWYSSIAPISWAVTDHVVEGREDINYSEFNTNQDEADDTIEVVLDGEMPPAYYTLFGLHPQANLSQAEVAELVAGLRATPGLSGDGGEGGDGGEDHEDPDDG